MDTLPYKHVSEKRCAARIQSLQDAHGYRGAQGLPPTGYSDHGKGKGEVPKERTSSLQRSPLPKSCCHRLSDVHAA